MTRWQIKREPLMPEKNDTISRAEAFAAISCDIVITGKENSKIVFKTICEFANRINSLPSVQPERQTGKWEHHMSYGICLKCGYEYNWTGADAKNFCPNCGVDMRGEQDGRFDQ